MVYFLSFFSLFFISYITSLEVLNETNLPPKESYYNFLTKTHISDADYEMAQNVYQTLGLPSLYHQASLYQRLDIYLLIDVLNEFRLLALTEFSIEPLLYYTLPSWSFSVRAGCYCLYVCVSTYVSFINVISVFSFSFSLSFSLSLRSC